MEHVVTGTLNTFEQIEVGRQGSVAHIALNRPEKRNALSLALMQEMISALEELGRDQDVRAIVIEGAGPAFSAGHDLAELVGRELAYYQDTFDTCVRMMNAIHVVPQPVIARVHGVATAAGCQLVAACDLAVAAESARFGTPGVKIGLFCSTPMVPISRAVGRKPDRGADRREHGARLGARQPRRPGRRARRRRRRARRADRAHEPAHRRDRQGGLLRADRPRRAAGLRRHEDRDGDERARGRCAGGHLRVPREARPDLDGRVGGDASARRAG